MTVRHITYTNDQMSISANYCRSSALVFGCDTSAIYTETDLERDFYLRNETILKADRGCGYWIWKPQIILQEFKKCNPGDLVLYTDAGVEIINRISHLIPYIEDGILFFGSKYKHAEWCKGDVLMAYSNELQLQASAMIFEYTPKNVKFVTAWLELCEIPGHIDDSPSVLPNAPGFQEHRHDQAILTEMQIMLGIKSHYWPALYKYKGGQFKYPKLEHNTETYPLIFLHHRKRNNEW